MTYDKAFDLLMWLECRDLPDGGYIEDDNGAGPCKWGWTERKLRAIGWQGRVKDLTREEAKALTRTHFWERYRLNALTSSRFATMLLCQLFNREANVQLWQAAVGVIVDSVVGPKTVAATNNRNNKWMDQLGGIEHCIGLFLDLSRMTYLHLVIAEPTRNEKFLNGWLGRLETLRERAR